MKTSESIKEIAGALVKAQEDVKNLCPSGKGYNYSYVPLNEVIDMLKTILPRHGLGYIQLPCGGQSGATVGLTTRIIHESGEWFEETAEFPVTDMKGINATQKAGAAITYFRRYALLSAFGITGDKDVDVNDKAFPQEEPPLAAAEQTELQKKTVILENWIKSGALTGNGLKKAQFYIKNKDLEGINRTIEWCAQNKAS